jgi:hypothetical protein
LVVAEIAIGLGAVVSVFVGVVGFDVGGCLGQLAGFTVAVEAFEHRWGLRLFDLSVTIGALNALFGVEFAEFSLRHVGAIGGQGDADSQAGQDDTSGNG